MISGKPKSVKAAPAVKRPEAKRHALTKSLLEQARSARDQGEEKTFAIDNPRGLFIRIRNGEILYYVQARRELQVVKRKICGVADVNFAEIKKIAADAIAAIKNGRDVNVVIEAGLAKKTEQEVKISLDQAEARAQNLWTFGTAVDEFAARKTIKNGVAKVKLSDASVREIEDRLRNRPEAASLMKRYVKELGINDFEQVRDQIDANATGASNGAKFIDLSKRVLKWAAKFRRRLTGLDPVHPWWSALAHEYTPGQRAHRYLRPEQIGMLIALLEGVRALEDRGNDAVFGALQLTWMIVQRVSALVGMESLASTRWQNDPVAERKGWRVYTWRAEEVKGKRETKLSIPPTAISILERVANESKLSTYNDSIWAFPQTRNKYLLRVYAESGNKENIRKLDKHITPSSLNHALDALAGRKRGWPNLLDMVDLPDRIGPHDLRRSLTTFFENRGQGSYASALLDHKVTGLDKMSEEVAAVTQGVYSAADRVLFKAEALELWLAAIMPYYEKAKLDPRLGTAIEARSQSLKESKRKGFEKRKAFYAARRGEKDGKLVNKSPVADRGLIEVR